MTLEEKLQHFYDRAIEDATEEKEQILSEYQASLDRMFEEHQSEKLRAAEAKVAAEKAALYRDRNKELSQKQIEIRHELAEKQAGIREEIFAAVEEKLLAFKQTEQYEDWICRKILISQKVANGEAMEIYIDPSDEEKKDRIEEATGTNVIISNQEFLGGVRIVIRSRKILIDDSFAALALDAKDRFSFEGGSGR